MSENGFVPWEALEAEVVPVELVSPSGKRVTFHMRALTHQEMATIRRKVATPLPPVSDMRRNLATGQVERVYNESDPAYQAKLAESQDRLVVFGLLQSLTDLEPGGTDEERYLQYTAKVAMWASAQLIDAFNRVNGFGPAAMAEAQAALTPFVGGPSPSSPDSGGPGETGKG